MELILKSIRYWKIFILFFLINSAILITPFSLQGEQAYTDFSVDTGTLIVQDSIDAGGNSFMFTDNVSVLNNVVINNFSVDDVIQILNAEEGMYSFSNDGRDVVIVYNNNGVINKIELKDVVDSTALIYDEASFENNIGFDAFTIAGDEWAMPGKASLISPSERVANKNPTFIWNEVPNATWYRLFIWDEHEDTVFRQWYEASQICSVSRAAFSRFENAPICMAYPSRAGAVLIFSGIGAGPGSGLSTTSTRLTQPVAIIKMTMNPRIYFPDPFLPGCTKVCPLPLRFKNERPFPKVIAHVDSLMSAKIFTSNQRSPAELVV